MALTVADEYQLKEQMRWSMYVKDDAYFHGPYDTWVLDTKTDAPDGTYPVTYSYNLTAQADGIVVKDGHFDLVPTMRACEDATRQVFQIAEGSFDHVFIERLQFDPASGVFTLTLGS